MATDDDRLRDLVAHANLGNDRWSGFTNHELNALSWAATLALGSFCVTEDDKDTLRAMQCEIAEFPSKLGQRLRLGEGSGRGARPCERDAIKVKALPEDGLHGADCRETIKGTKVKE